MDIYYARLMGHPVYGENMVQEKGEMVIFSVCIYVYVVRCSNLLNLAFIYVLASRNLGGRRRGGSVVKVSDL